MTGAPFPNAARRAVPGTRPRATSRHERGFALFTTLVVMFVVALVVATNLRTTELSERLSGSFIQRNRAFNAAEGALLTGELGLSALLDRRAFASSDAGAGIHSRDTVETRWWREDDYAGSNAVAPGTFTGVASAPAWVVEEIGDYVADGGAGIVSLDRGAAGYGRKTDAGREIVLYRLQSAGTGSDAAIGAVVESLYVQAH